MIQNWITLSEANPLFGTPEFFGAVAAALAADEVWAKKASNLTASMVYVYGEPMNRAMSVRFESGVLVSFESVDPSSPPAADFVISASGSLWKAIATKQAKPTTAMASGKLKVKGKQTVLLRNMSAFTRLMDLMTQLPVEFDC